ncbi:MAG TPA: hypothetical protein DCQ28_06355, partial [Bacteroidetes bacterium]|nr:hypothetical protein [Bacteroidota bacterium]
MKRIVSLSVMVMVCVVFSQAQITSAADGNWSAGATWTGGVVPTENDDVVIANTVSIDIPNAKCKNLTVSGNLYFAITNGNGITIFGNTTIDAGKRFRMASATPSSGTVMQTIDFKGDLTVNSTGVFDMRQTSSAIGSVGRVIFSGTTNSTIKLSLSIYTSSTEEFNSVEINKTGGAKVILATGNLYQNNNTSNIPDTLILTSGIIETQGTSVWAMLRTSSTAIVGGSPSSYFTGKLGVGITNSGGNGERTFPVGDQNSYRPINVRCQGPANSTGHFVWAQHFAGDANTGTSTFTGGIDKVSKLRYYEIGYTKGSAAAMSLYGFSPTYSDGDGVNPGNMDLRVAYSTNARATWNGVGPTTDTTKLSGQPQLIASDSIAPSISVADGASMFVAIARATGTTTNSLEGSVPTPQFTLNSKSFNFGSLKINTTKSDSVMITNNGTAALSVSSILSTSIDFQVLTSIVNVNPGSSVYVKITFMPVTVGTKSGSIILTHNAASAKDTVSVSGTATPATSVKLENSIPTAFAIQQNFPNPFNPTTMITYQLPTNSSVLLSVYDILGKEVATLVNAKKEAGHHSVQFNA